MHSESMKRCSRCVLPESYPGIVFDGQGVCNYCHAHKTQPLRPEAKLHEILDSYRGKHAKYDCIVALSGGRDSSFMLWLAKKRFGLRVLACFVDNGFVPDQTRTNIKSAVDAMGVELVVKKHDHVKNCFRHSLKSWMRKPAPGMIGLLCGGCNYGLRYHLLEMAAEHRVPLMLFGVGEPEPQTSFAEKLLMRNPDNRLSKLALATGFASKMAGNPSYLMDGRAVVTYFKEFAFRWSPGMRKRMLRKIAYPEFKTAEPFYYIAWDEGEITSVIERELGWRKVSYAGSSWRTDCKIATFKNYLYGRTLGFSKIDELLSNMIRTGMLTRETAIERFAHDSSISEDFVRDFLAENGLDIADLDRAIARRAAPH